MRHTLLTRAGFLLTAILLSTTLPVLAQGEGGAAEVDWPKLAMCPVAALPFVGSLSWLLDRLVPDRENAARDAETALKGAA